MAAGEGRSIWVVDDRYTIKCSWHDTSGAYAMIELIAPGNGPPPHIHSRDASLVHVPHAHSKRLNAVLNKIGDVLADLVVKHLKEKRQAVTKSGAIYQLKVTLKDSDPPIWRRIQVPDCTLGELHNVVQVVMGKQDNHLHQLIVRGEYYGPLDPEDVGWDMEMEDERKISDQPGSPRRDGRSGSVIGSGSPAGHCFCSQRPRKSISNSIESRLLDHRLGSRIPNSDNSLVSQDSPRAVPRRRRPQRVGGRGEGSALRLA